MATMSTTSHNEVSQRLEFQANALLNLGPQNTN